MSNSGWEGGFGNGVMFVLGWWVLLQLQLYKTATTPAEHGEQTYHILPNLLRLLLVDPLRETPMLLRNQPILCRPTRQRRRQLLELGIKRLIVQEHPIVVELVVEPVLDLADTLCNFPDVRVAGERDERCVCALAGGDRGGGQTGVGRVGRGAVDGVLLLLRDLVDVDEGRSGGVGACVDFEEHGHALCGC